MHSLELGADETFPFSHSRQAIDPLNDVNPAGHGLQMFDGVSVPMVPAVHARNLAQFSLAQFVM